MPGLYYSGTKLKSKLYVTGEGSTNGIPNVSQLRTNHVVLPESVNLYMRYDNRYLYVAIELVEADHKKVRYDDEVRFGATINQSQGITMTNYSLDVFYRKELDESTA